MKSYKQLLSEVVTSAISGGKGGPSLGPATDGDFASIRGLGINTGDSITANLSGKGFGKKQTTKDFTPEITAAIEAGKSDGSIEEDENGKLSFRGIDGEFHNSPYAANEASTSFAKTLLQTAGMDPTVSEKGAETLVGLKKSGYLRYNYKEGKVYVNDNEVGSFDRTSKESIENMTKKIPVNILNGIIKSTLEETKPLLKRLVSRGNRSARKNATKLTTALNSLNNMLDNISDDTLNAMLPTMLNGLSSISGGQAGEEAPPQQAYSTIEPPVGGTRGIPLRPPGWRFRGGDEGLGGGARGIRPGGGGRVDGDFPILPPGWRFKNPQGYPGFPGQPPTEVPPTTREDLKRVLDIWRLLNPWIPTIDDLNPHFPEGHPWHNPNQGSGQQGGGPTQQGGGPQGPMGQVAGPEIEKISNTFNEIGNLMYDMEGSYDPPAQTAGQSSLPFDLDGGGGRGPGYLSPPSNVPGLQPERKDRNVVDPPGRGLRPKKLDPKYFYPNGTPRIPPAGYGGGDNPQWGKPWATPETDRQRPQLRQGPNGPYWYTPPLGPPSQAQQQQGGPTEIPRKRWIWGDKNSPWSSPGRSVGTRPEFEGEVPIQPAPPENPRDFKRWAYERLQRWYQENPGQTPPPHILDDYLYWDQPERRRNPKRKGWWRPLF